MGGTMAQGFFVGRLTRDAELKYTSSGMAICHFSLATDSRVKKGDQWVDEPSFWEVDLWGKLGETLNQYLTKGKPVAVTGPQRIETWEKDGVKHSKVKIDAKEVILLGSREEGQGGARGGSSGNEGGQGRGNAGTPPPRGQASGSPSPAGDDFTDDIPF